MNTGPVSYYSVYVAPIESVAACCKLDATMCLRVIFQFVIQQRLGHSAGDVKLDVTR